LFVIKTFILAFIVKTKLNMIIIPYKNGSTIQLPLDNEGKKTGTCAHCGATPCPVACQKCKYTTFCTADCQEKHKESHTEVCNKIFIVPKNKNMEKARAIDLDSEEVKGLHPVLDAILSKTKSSSA
jgi:hypothetical protein